MAHIKLDRAILCLDCETIGDNPEQCVLCLSVAVHPISSFLNREVSDEYREAIAHTCADINTEIMPCEACSR